MKWSCHGGVTCDKPLTYKSERAWGAHHQHPATDHFGCQTPRCEMMREPEQTDHALPSAARLGAQDTIQKPSPNNSQSRKVIL